MNMYTFLIEKPQKRTQRKIHYFLGVLFVLFVVCGLASETIHAQVYYPILKLDVGASNDEAQREDGFHSFTRLDSGSVFEGLTVTLETNQENGAMDSRWRGGPTGIPLELLFRDFIFARPGGFRLTLSGLVPSKTYQITIFAYDTGSAGQRIADWVNVDTNEVVLTTSFSSADSPTEATHGFSGLTQADENGTLILEAVANPDHPGDVYAFINGLIVATDTPITKSRLPVPADGAVIITTAVELRWQPGQTSVSSNIYLGESYDDVNNATTADTDIFRGNFEAITFMVGTPGNPYPDGLTRGATYYWRTDEIEEDGTVHKGDVWSFAVASEKANNPDPVDDTVYIKTNVDLTWTPGVGAVEHHVYFGDSLENVTAGTGDTDKGVVTDPNFSPGPLEYEKIYYWRIDESDGTETHTGPVWSFTTTLPGLGGIPMDRWDDVGGDYTLENLFSDPRYPDQPDSSELLTAFDSGQDIGDNYGARIYGWLYVPMSGDYRFYFTSADEGQFWLSTDETPANAQMLLSEQTWGTYNNFNHRTEPISLVSGEKYYIETVWKESTDWDHCQVAWEGPGVRGLVVIDGGFLSPFSPETSYTPYPSDGDTDVPVNPTLRWIGGINAEKYNVYLGTSMEDVNNVNADNLADYPGVAFVPISESTYAPEVLDPNTTYFWRVDDINSAQPDMVWRGKIWNFTTGYIYIVDDFESYNDIPEGEEGSNLVYSTWKDGFDNPLNGSTVGYTIPFEPTMESLIVHGGKQSMPFFYNNIGDVAYSEAERTFASAQDWTLYGFDTLVVQVYGDPNNAAEPLYVSVEDQDGQNKVLTHPVSALLQHTQWQPWEIPLADFSGVDMTRVKKLIVGVANEAGGSGVFYLDDIILKQGVLAASTKITYVDATDGEGNTSLATGDVFSPVDVGSNGSGADGLWRVRGGFSNGGTIYESRGDWGSNNTEDCPRRKTSVVVPEGDFEVYA